ncbi:MAG: hypothetical protein INF18_14400 [Methylobacterium sp.]|nr:hypothetical protein [Methylobacterium sp.]
MARCPSCAERAAHLSEAGRALARGQVRAALTHSGAVARSAAASLASLPTPTAGQIGAKVAAILAKVR